MGWWVVDNIESGRAKVPQNTNDITIGDEPADAMGDCLDRVNSIYEKGLGRLPQKDEIIALFNFVFKARGYKNLPADEG